tara:strand:- start:726 stop:1151 length:426 start_codon:yes stop_codon:yes gene_type:complete
MWLEITNKPRALKMSVLKKAIAYAEDYLNMNTDIDVDITFTKNLDAHGWAMDIEYGQYEIEVRHGLTPRQLVKTILHELVHVDQYEKGRLVSAEGKKPNRWMGKVCRAAYADQPWEIEAYKLENRMYRNFMRKCKKEGVNL